MKLYICFISILILFYNEIQMINSFHLHMKFKKTQVISINKLKSIWIYPMTICSHVMIAYALTTSPLSIKTTLYLNSNDIGASDTSNTKIKGIESLSNYYL